MKIRFLFVLLGCVLFVACNKDKQSCSDGIFTPEQEEKKDCGGVCPPCKQSTTDPDDISYFFVTINGTSVQMDSIELKKSTNWIMQFSNDSIAINLNFGNGDSLGARPIQPISSTATFEGQNFPLLINGIVAFTELDQSEKYMSGNFQATFTTSGSSSDTLHVDGGQFQKIDW